MSFFYCYDSGGALRLVLAEVNNTFGGSHNYWLEPQLPRGGQTPGSDPTTADGVLEPQKGENCTMGSLFRAASPKSFYVSPFMPPDMTYAFAFTEPGDRLIAHMALERTIVGDAPHVFDVVLALDFRPWTAPAIARALLRHPVMTANVIAGIHWEALRLWWRGLPIVPRPTPDGVHPEYAAPDAGRP